VKYGRYQIEEELGRGSMGVVYSAYDPQIDRRVAIKVLREDRVTSEEFVQRFLKESRSIGRLNHPNILTVYDAGKDHNAIFIAMEFLEGRTLNEVIRERRLSINEIVDIGVQIASALDYAHSKNIIHRDIKPSNIFITRDNRPIIADFGIARMEDPTVIHRTQAGVILGTPGYMSPEQVKGEPVDGRTDLFSLGVILYELTTGKTPFEGDTLPVLFRAIEQDTPLVPTKIDSRVPPLLSSLIMKSLNKRTEKRFQTGKEMAQDLKACLKRRGSDIQGEKRSRKRTALVALIALVVFVTFGIVVLLFNPFSSEQEPRALLRVKSSEWGTEIFITGAKVFIDGSFKGTTPLEIELPLNKYEVSVRSKGYEPYDAQITLPKKGLDLPVTLVSQDEQEL
jgi:serine/threonine protein kinase